jgi:TM2 domain-containing membrane protein YozV
MVVHNSGDIENPSDVKKFCSNCGEQIDTRAEICPNCGVRAMPSSAKNPAVAAILSFFVVGLGQVYNGKYRTAILMFVLAVISAMLWGIGIGVITSLIVWIWSMTDAWNVAKKAGGSTSGSGTTVVLVVVGLVVAVCLTVILAAVIGAFVFGMGESIDGDTTTTSTQAPTGVPIETYNYRGYGFSFEYPSDMYILEEGYLSDNANENSGMVTVKNEKETKDFVVSWYSTTQPSRLEDELQQVIDFIEEDSEFSDMSMGPVVETNIVGDRMICQTLDYRIEGIKCYTIISSWYDPESQRMFYIGADSWDEKETEELFNEVVDSFVRHLG